MSAGSEIEEVLCQCVSVNDYEHEYGKAKIHADWK